ncbi:MAG TPA: YqgE/AlgH family protein [Acidimicrobiia bacterium]|jgi:putative transcriptional regulator
MVDSPSTARRLLVATPALLDPNFFRTVVFVIEHTDDAALGVVLNRPSEVDIAEALPDWADLATAPGVAFVGGPVQAHEALIGIGRTVDASPPPAGTQADDGWYPLLDRFGTVDLGRRPDDLAPAVDGVRVFAGYAAWGPRQLEGELDEHAWFVVDALPGDLLTSDPAALWRQVLRRQGGELAMVANQPVDPRTN